MDNLLHSTFIIGSDYHPSRKGKFPNDKHWEAVLLALQVSGGRITGEAVMQVIYVAAISGGYPAINIRGFLQGRVREGHLVTA